MTQSNPLLFNPSRASFEELEQTFVGRRPLLAQLEADIEADAERQTSRHWQLIGPRGTGKSHITELLGRRLQRGGRWAVVRLPEEHYQIASVGELLEQIVLRLPGIEYSPFQDIANMREVEERGLDFLRAWQKKDGRKILVVLENLALLFERQLTSKRDQHRLREILMRDAPFTLVTTSTSFLAATSEHSAPFYEFFQSQSLDDLTRGEVTALVQARAEYDNEELLLKHFESVKARLDALFHLSGGNPRLVLALYSIIRQGITSELHQQLMQLLDEVTPYYQARLRDIAPQMERVLVEMSLAENALTPSEVGRRCRMPTNQASANINKLVAERLVRPGGRPDKRRRYYRVSDRLFRIWLQMREDRTARHRLKFLVEFFQYWYSGNDEEVEQEVRRLSTAFWSELRQGLTKKCGDRLLTLDYLRAALPEYPSDFVLRSLQESTARPSGAATQEQIKLLEPLWASAEDPDRRDVIAYLLAVAYDHSGARKRALSMLRNVMDAKTGTPSSPAMWMRYLDMVASIEGPAAAINIGAEAMESNPSLFGLKTRLSHWYVDLEDSRNAIRLTREFIEESVCDHCRERAVAELVRWFLGSGKVGDARTSLKLCAGSRDDVDRAALEMLIERRDEGEHSANATDLLDVLGLYPSVSDVPHWLIRDCACQLTHANGYEDRVFELILEIAEREINVDSDTVTHVLELLTKLTHAPERFERTLSWLLQIAPASQIRECFVMRMPGLSQRPECDVLGLFRSLREAGALPKDLLPYAAADRLEAEPDREASLDAMHPEVREAVLLLRPSPGHGSDRKNGHALRSSVRRGRKARTQS